jgi:hypothetical protein
MCNFHKNQETIMRYGEPSCPDYDEWVDSHTPKCEWCKVELREDEVDFCEACWKIIEREDEERL